MIRKPLIPITRLSSDLRCRLRLTILGRRSLSAASTNPNEAATSTSAAGNDGGGGSKEVSRDEAYRQVQNLDFMTATKILFTTPPKRNKFGLDFHLVQFFFALMPSLAVYLVAQYARYEIRRMEAEVELKKKQTEEEEKAKAAAEVESSERVEPDPALSKVIVRLDALEETVKEIVVERQKGSPVGSIKGQEVGDKTSDPQIKPGAGEPTPDRSMPVGGSSLDGSAREQSEPEWKATSREAKK